jgi:uncharacterized protein YdaU (DUF1376 family)
MSDEGGLVMLPWFPRDFIASTLGWKLAERGLYMALLGAQWELGSLPNDLEELAVIAGAKPDEFAQAWPRVSVKFRISEGRLFNPRLEQHREKSTRLKHERSSAGKRGGRASAATRQAKTQANAEANAQANGQSKTKPPSPSPSPVDPSCNSTLSLSLTSSGAQKNPRADDEPKKQQPVEMRGTRIPLPFLVTDDLRAWAQIEAPHVDLRKATAEFEDYWRGVPGAKGRKVDWAATWKNRMREQQARAGAGKRGGNDAPMTKHDRIIEALRNG